MKNIGLKKVIILGILCLLMGICFLPEVTCNTSNFSNIACDNLILDLKDLSINSNNPPAVEWIKTFGIKLE